MTPRLNKDHGIILSFLSKYPASDAEAITNLLTTSANNFGHPAGKQITEKTALKKLNSLQKIGAVQGHTNPITGKRQFGITAIGHEASEIFGNHQPTWGKMEGLKLSRLEHFRAIALTASRLTSPHDNRVKKALKLTKPIPLNRLIGEYEISHAYQTAERTVKQLRENGEETANFAEYRAQLYNRLADEAEAGIRTWESISRDYPTLWTLGYPNAKQSGTKPVQVPDLAIRLDTETNRNNERPEANNIAVEIELSAKRADEYEQILRTYDAEITGDRTAYRKLIYITGSKAVENAIRRADENIGLIRGGKLGFIRLTDNAGNTIDSHRTVPTPRKVIDPTVPPTNKPQRQQPAKKKTPSWVKNDEPIDIEPWDIDELPEDEAPDFD